VKIEKMAKGSLPKSFKDRLKGVVQKLHILKMKC
jgi:hypothetical protein